MNKKIFGFLALIILGTVSKADLTDRVSLNSESSNITSSNEEKSEEDEEREIKAKRKEAVKNVEGTNVNVRDTGKLSQNFDFDKMFDEIDNYWEKVSDGTDTVFNVLSGVGDTITAITGVAGSFPFMGGIATVGTNIQAVLQKILAIKNRVDQLKQYKRYIDSVKSLGKNDFKNIVGVYNTLNSLSEMINEGVKLVDASKGLNKDIINADLSTTEGWELLLNGDLKIQEQNNTAYEKIAGEDYKLALKTINDTKRKLQQISSKNEVQNLQQLNGQMNLLIGVMEQLLNNQSSQAAIIIQSENKKIEEEIAAKQIKGEEVERLLKEQQEAEKLLQQIKMGNKFVGSVNGNR